MERILIIYGSYFRLYDSSILDSFYSFSSWFRLNFLSKRDIKFLASERTVDLLERVMNLLRISSKDSMLIPLSVEGSP
jgi:hypothetical protein